MKNPIYTVTKKGSELKAGDLVLSGNRVALLVKRNREQHTATGVYVQWEMAVNVTEEKSITVFSVLRNESPFETIHIKL